MSETTVPTISISMSRKLNLGNYESADVFVCLSGVPAGASEDEIQALLDTGNLAYPMIAATLKEKCATARQATKQTA